jgi:hypothetical protein
MTKERMGEIALAVLIQSSKRGRRLTGHEICTSVGKLKVKPSEAAEFVKQIDTTAEAELSAS